MMPKMDVNLKAPFTYFGGKGTIASVVWEYLGDVKQYIEPFFGSGAVLLKRPPTKLDKIYEIVNDKDGFVANVWRSIIFNPSEVVKWCAWPINHADLNARRKVLIANEGYLIKGLQDDPEWHDAKLAGYWIWAASCWIAAGLTCPNARPHLAWDSGIHSKIPHLTHDKGIHSQRPHLTGDIGIQQWINALQNRLRYVKVVCGDWERVCGGNWQDNNKPVGFFFDPPYATAGRHEKIYHHDSITVGKDVEKWCLERGKNPNYRIVVCGYDDEYTDLVDNGWTVHKWKARGGYANRNGPGSNNAIRERLFTSPFCLTKSKHLELF